VDGVTFDGRHVWFASNDGLRSLDPATGTLARRLDVPCDAGTAFDGRHIFQIAGASIQHIDPDSAEVITRLVMPEGTGVSGLESDGDGTLYCGGGRSGKVRAVKRPKR
jgi:hypothetical protein